MRPSGAYMLIIVTLHLRRHSASWDGSGYRNVHERAQLFTTLEVGWVFGFANVPVFALRTGEFGLFIAGARKRQKIIREKLTFPTGKAAAIGVAIAATLIALSAGG